MGITIHASGRIDRIEDIPCLIDEMKAIAEQNGWEYEIFDDDFGAPPNAAFRAYSGEPGGEISGSLGLKGIVLSIGTGVEPLAVLFDQSGVLTDILSQISWLHGDRRQERLSACKTQFGSINAHVHIIDLMAILKEKYLPDLSVEDEGCYWTTRNLELLAEKRAVLAHYIRHTEKVVSSIETPSDSSQDPDSIASHIAEALLKAETKTGKLQ